jgi:hypothetical protein
MTLTEALDIGVTRTLTKREEHKRQAGAFLTLFLAAGSLWIGLTLGALVRGVDRPRLVFRSVTTGTGEGRPLLDFSGQAADPDSAARWQFPVQFVSPEINWWITGPIAVVVFVVLFRFTAARLFRSRGNVRHRSLADTGAIEAGFGRKQARAAGKFTLPGTTWWQRSRLPMRAFAVYVGRATSAKAGDLWVSSNRRVRIVARSGWGKSHRLMIPIIRNLVGPALISSIETDIFTATVKAREQRWPDGRPRRLPERVPGNPFIPGDKGTWQRPVKEQYPVFVIDCSPAAGKLTTKYPSPQWNPIPGCENYATALRRAEALVCGVDPESGGSSSETANWFKGSASEVLAAWLHAAAFDPSIEITDFAKWLREKDVDSPSYILTTFASQADPSAITNLQKHLDPAGERTTSSVERFTARALAGMISHEGQKILGRRDDPDPFDMEALVEAQGTLYLLAEPEQMKIVRPVLSLIASEMVLAAEQVARHKTGTHKRLPLPFYAILDELRFGVRLPTLPYISNVLRKFGIDYVYACTNGGDEEALYGEADADILQTNATSIYGGFDKRSAPEINDVAGRADVVVASRNDDGGVTQSEDHPDVLTAADLQKLGDGGAVIVQGGTAPFLAYIPSTFEDKKLRKRMARELHEVTA